MSRLWDTGELILLAWYTRESFPILDNQSYG